MYLFSEETSITQHMLVDQNMQLLADLENQHKELEKEHRWADKMEKALKSIPGSSIAAAELCGTGKTIHTEWNYYACVIASFVAENVK